MPYFSNSVDKGSREWLAGNGDGKANPGPAGGDDERKAGELAKRLRGRKICRMGCREGGEARGDGLYQKGKEGRLRLANTAK